MSFKTQLSVGQLRRALGDHPDSHLVYFDAIPHGAFMHGETQPAFDVVETEVSNGHGVHRKGVLIKSHDPQPATED